MKQSIKPIVIGLFIIGLLIYANLNYKLAKTNGLSMYPTIESGETLVIAIHQQPKVGDIVSVRINYEFGNTSEYIVKRVTAIENGEMYLLGDNPEVSYDSRFYGYVPLEMLDGVVVFHY